MPFTSYSDWVGANAGNEADVTARALSKAQGGDDPNAIGNALKAGQAGGGQNFSDQATAAKAGSSAAGGQSYGDFLKALQGDSSTAAGALGGGATAFDAMLMKGSSGDLLTQAQHAYDQKQNGIASAYASGQRNAAASTPGARATQAADTRRAGFGWNTNTAAGASGLGAELKAGKDAQQASRDAGAKYRLAQERKAFEADQKRNAGIEQGVSAILNPMQGLAWASTDFGHGHQTDFSRTVGDPFGLGGDAHSGFGPGGKFGSPLGMGDASQGDPFGQYSQDDAGFTAWLKKNGYDPTTGNGGGY